MKPHITEKRLDAIEAIAAANPETIIAMVAEIRRLRSAGFALINAYREFSDKIGNEIETAKDAFGWTSLDEGRP